MQNGRNDILIMENITKEFPGVKALNNVSLTVQRENVHALVGENGAGKSTLMKILSGVYTEYDGQVVFNGEKVHFNNEREAIDAGIAIVSQELNLVSELTVSENIYLGREPTTKAKVFRAQKKQMQSTEQFLETMGLNFKADDKILALSVAQRQLVEIIKAISGNAKIIIMDEPTSSLTDIEIRYLFEQIKRLKERGITIIYISHKLEEIMEVCDRVSVLRDGQFIGECAVADITKKQIIHMMVGRELAEIYPKLPVPGKETVLEVEHFYRKGEFEDVSFHIHKGEILGFAGMVGAGRSEVAKSIFRLTKPDVGMVRVEGKKLNARTTGETIKNGIAMVTEDRAMYGFVGVRSIRENILLANCDKLAGRIFVDRRRTKAAVEEISKQLAVKAPGMETTVVSLSGGNQQKVVLAKWLVRNIKVLIVDEPTRGIDVGAKCEIYRLLATLAEQGLSIILIRLNFRRLSL